MEQHQREELTRQIQVGPGGRWAGGEQGAL